jgi:serine protease Do
MNSPRGRTQIAPARLARCAGGPAARCTARGAALLCGAALFWASAAAQEPAALDALEEQTFRQAAALVAPSLVRIDTVGGLDRVEQVLTGTGPTTGVIVGAEGYIISSAFNFASRPASILVTLPDGRRLPAAAVATDKVKMLTLLKVEAADLPVPVPAPREAFRVGQWTIALGKTLDEVPSVSVGILSAVNRIWGKALQTDAKISPVNYGGALVDIEGRVMGILVPLSPTASGEVAGVEWYDSGIGFAVPLVDVLDALPRLKQGKDLFPGLMGITLKGQDIYQGQPVVDRVRYGSPAHDAGLKPGDTLLALDGKPVERQAHLRHVMGNKYAGDKLQLKFKRGDEELERELLLVNKLVPYESAYLGVLPAREQAGAQAPPGVGVRHVVLGGPAEGSGLARGDRIVKWNGSDVASAEALADQVSRQRPQEKARLTVASPGGTREIEVTLGSFPPIVPLELRPAPMAPREKELPNKELKLSHFTEKMPAHDHEYWAFVPEDYNPDYKYGLVVWLHPPFDTMEAAMLKNWQSPCEERGLIFLAPKAKQLQGWIPDEMEFVKDCIEEMTAKYSIDKQRVALHTFGGTGAFAWALAFKHRELIKGLSAVAAPLPSPPPDNEPEFRQQFHLVSGDDDPAHRSVMFSAKGLRDRKFPVVHTTVTNGTHKYPPVDYVQEIAVWVDALDQL